MRGQAEYNCKTPQDNWSLGRDLNCGPRRHDTRVPLTRSQHLYQLVMKETHSVPEIGTQNFIHGNEDCLQDPALLNEEYTLLKQEMRGD